MHLEHILFSICCPPLLFFYDILLKCYFYRFQMLDETKTDVKFKFCITLIKVTSATATLFVGMNNCQMMWPVCVSVVTKMCCSCVSLSPAAFSLWARLPSASQSDATVFQSNLLLLINHVSPLISIMWVLACIGTCSSFSWALTKKKEKHIGSNFSLWAFLCVCFFLFVCLFLLCFVLFFLLYTELACERAGLVFVLFFFHFWNWNIIPHYGQ